MIVRFILGLPALALGFVWMQTVLSGNFRDASLAFWQYIIGALAFVFGADQVLAAMPTATGDSYFGTIARFFTDRSAPRTDYGYGDMQSKRNSKAYEWLHICIVPIVNCYLFAQLKRNGRDPMPTLNMTVVAFCETAFLYFIFSLRFAGLVRRRTSQTRTQKKVEHESHSRTLQQTANESQVRLDKKRNANARAACELHYNLHEADILQRFDRKIFNEFMATYMSDTDDADVVERRGSELRAIIDGHLQRVGQLNRPTTIDQLAKWYIDEKTVIERLDIAEEMKAEHLSHLELRYADLSQEILENVRP